MGSTAAFYNKHSFLAASVWLLALLATCPQTASSQPNSALEPWPAKPLRIIVGYPAGSSPDVLARLLAEPLARALGQAVVVENKPGAGGNIGADAIAKADDGHTIGVIGNGPLTSSKFLYLKLAYDPLKDFAPIVLIGSAPLVWIAPAPNFAAPLAIAETLKQMRASGDKLAYGSVGAGSGGHLGMELIKASLGIAPLHVPFAGGPAILNAMLGGQVQTTLLPGSTESDMALYGALIAKKGIKLD